MLHKKNVIQLNFMLFRIEYIKYLKKKINKKIWTIQMARQ